LSTSSPPEQDNRGRDKDGEEGEEEEEGEDGSGRLIYVLGDWGLSQGLPRGPAQCSLKVECGTVAYMPPEMIATPQRGCEYGLPADIWSLGVTCFTLLAGQSPWCHQPMGPTQTEHDSACR
jgi:serine/threonine protein kinase